MCVALNGAESVTQVSGDNVDVRAQFGPRGRCGECREECDTCRLRGLLRGLGIFADTFQYTALRLCAFELLYILILVLEFGEISQVFIQLGLIFIELGFCFEHIPAVDRNPLLRNGGAHIGVADRIYG